MNSSLQWFEYFSENLQKERIDWSTGPSLTQVELDNILSSLQAWQLGETSDGSNLLRASGKYAALIQDEWYVKAVELFIREEQKHGNNLGRYLDMIGQPRIRSNWGDTLFRKIRYFNTSMEIWTLTVLVVESSAQLFYQSLKNATRCRLLQQICTDILIDEAAHIRFQVERMSVIYQKKTPLGRWLAQQAYSLFYHATAIVVWFAHRKLFRAGGNGFLKYYRKMKFKFSKTIGVLPQKTLTADRRPLTADH